jgi:polyhydroxyalkanoate synthesis regulator phasin
MAPDEESKQSMDETKSLHYGLRRMMLAGIGFMSIMHEKLEKHIDKLAERGETVEKDRESMIKEMQSRREKFIKDRKGYTQKRVTEALEHLDIPSKSDLDTINTKLSSLEKKIDELNETK